MDVVKTLAKRRLHVRRDGCWWRAGWPVRRHNPGARPPGDPCAGVKPVELRQRLTAAIRAQFGRPTGFWGRAAGLLMAHRTSNRRRNAWAVSLLDVRSEDRVLEIGFGPGLAIRELGRLAGKGYVCGIDHSELMLRRAKRLNAEGLRHGVVDLRLGSVPEDLPAFDEPFDKILAVNATMFWREPVARLEELRRLLRSGGLIAVALYRTCPRRLLWPFASTRSWVGPQPQRDVGGLHRLPYRSHQVVTQGIQVSL